MTNMRRNFLVMLFLDMINSFGVETKPNDISNDNLHENSKRFASSHTLYNQLICSIHIDKQRVIII